MVENNREYFVYRHIRLDRNEPFYIGIGTKPIEPEFITEKCIYRRAYSCDKKSRSKAWMNIANKHGYKVEIIFETDNHKLILEKEREFVSLYGRISENTGTLINFTDGGEGRRGSTQEEKE